MIEIREEVPSAPTIAEYASVPMTVNVRSRLNPKWIEERWHLEEVPIAETHTKDYDTIENPLEWPARFDLSRWGMLAALNDVKQVGGTIIAVNTPEVDMLEGRSDLAVIWDIRVLPEYHGMGIGSKLFSEAIRWSKSHGCSELKVETQDINVPACRFYAKMGCELRVVRPSAYPELPDEIQFLWYREL